MYQNDEMVKVLFIDDSEAILEICSLVLSRFGYQVKTSFCGEDGIKTAIQFKPHVIFIDLVLPDICGKEAANKIANIMRMNKSQTAIFAFTSYDLSYCDKIIYGCEIRRCISKSMDLDVLSKDLRAAITEGVRVP